MDSNILTLVDEMQRIFKSANVGEFPYEDFRRLRRIYPNEFRNLPSTDLITADFNQYYMLICGLASGGFMRLMTDKERVVRVTHLLSGTFWERFPQYGFIDSAQLVQCTNLQAHLELAEQLRPRILKALAILLSPESE